MKLSIRNLYVQEYMARKNQEIRSHTFMEK